VVAEVDNLIRQVADQTGVETLDMTPPLAGHPEWFQPDHIHPNASGSRRIAEVTCGRLLHGFEKSSASKLSQVKK
jgi:hypothetical protein